MRRTLSAVIAVLAAPLALAQPFVIDGEFGDWGGRAPSFTDPTGDNTGPFDVTDLWVASDDERVVLRFTTGTQEHNLQAGEYGFLDALRFELTFNDADNTRLWVDCLQHLAQINRGSGYEDVLWSALGAELLPTYASSEYEFSVPSEIATGASTVRIEFFASDLLEAGPFQLLSGAAPTPPAYERHESADLRVVSLNTLNDFGSDITGLADPDRRPAYIRLIRFARADIYCFQEEYSTTAEEIEEFLESADPFDDGAEWNAVKTNDTVVATRFPTIAPPLFQRILIGDASTFIDLAPIGRGLLHVSSIHPRCCGYAGNSNDNDRISQHQNIARVIADIRNGDADGAVPGASDAAFLVAGDWNLVGSRTPLTLLEDAGLIAPPLPDLGTGENATTWRALNDFVGSFFSGRLDFIAHDDDRLTLLNGFVLNTTTMQSGDLATAGLMTGDSQASDHLMLVADYAFMNAPADLSGDGVVDAFDLSILLAAWGQSAPADLTGDGIVNTSDLAVLLAAWD